MNTNRLAHDFDIRLPKWIDDELADSPDLLPDLEARMDLVNRLADRNFREGNGGPFAAIVVESETGAVVSAGVNVVLSTNISSGHAEVTALGLAQRRVGNWDLGAEGLPAHQLVVNWRPCVQCYGATLWSGVTSLVVAGDGPELEERTGFDEGPMVADWAEQFERRGIAVTQDVRRTEAIEVFAAYGEHVRAGGALVYNARSGGGA